MNATTLHLEAAERQLTALSEQVAAMKAGASNAVLGNLAVDAELACMDLARTFGCLFGLAADAMCAEQDGNVVQFVPGPRFSGLQVDAPNGAITGQVQP